MGWDVGCAVRCAGISGYWDDRKGAGDCVPGRIGGCLDPGSKAKFEACPLDCGAWLFTCACGWGLLKIKIKILNAKNSVKLELDLCIVA